MAGLQQFTGCGHAHGFHPGGWRHADFRLEQPREMPRAETGALSQRTHREVLRGMRHGPALYFLQRRAASRSRMALAAELQLAAGTLEEHQIGRASCRERV